MAKFDKTYMMTIYTGEDVLYDDAPLYKVIMRKAHEMGIAGGTALKGIGGYASCIRGFGRAVNVFASGNGKLPIVLQFVDEYEKLEQLFPFLEKHTKHTFIVIDEVNFMVTDYIREKFPQYYGPDSDKAE